MSTIKSSTTSTTAYQVVADTTGTLVFQTGATPTTAMTLGSDQSVTFAGTPTYSGGTANGVAYLNGSKVLTTGSALVFDGTNLGVGVTPSAWTFSSLSIGGQAASFAGDVNTVYTQANAYYNAGWKYVGTGYAGQYQIDRSVTALHKWYTAPSGTAGNAITFTQAMTLDASGNLLLGITSYVATNANYLALQTSNGNLVTGHASGTPSGYQYAAYLYNGGLIGSITQNGTTGVLYNLTSDYRLKNNQEALTGAKDFIMALKPKKWQWWDGSGEGVGFVAHEFMEVAKYSGNGEKDAVDTDGNPVYQSIQPSSSEVMANLVSFVQELKAEIDSLKSQLNGA